MRPIALISATILLSACADRAADVAPNYKSPLMYSNTDCEYLSEELRRVESEVTRVSDDQDSHATRDALAMGVGLVVFWPALFVLAAGDDENRLADLKGEHEAMRVAYNQRGCVADKGAVATNISG